MLGPRFTLAAAIIAFSVLLLALIDRKPDELLVGAARAIDGDSLMVSGRQMRLKGLDAPESRQTCEIAGKSVACGREATLALRRWLGRGPVTCTGNEIDRYARLLVVCRVNGQDIGADLVRRGLAVDYGGYATEEAEARKDERGVWAGTFERPEAWRRRMRQERNDSRSGRR
jgi:endonuclease YncB( thermonuclease family)